jgi:hypothetical protein
LRCWILFFFTWRTVVALGVATCASVIILNIVYCLFFFPHFLDYVLLHVFCCIMMSILLFFVNWHTIFALALWLLHWWSSFMVLVIFLIFFSFVYYYVTMQAFSIFLVRELLTLINVVFLCRNLSLGLVTKARACESVG